MVLINHQRYRQTDRQTDAQTDGQTTCDRNTALCTIVHRAVKIAEVDGRYSLWIGSWYRNTIIPTYLFATLKPHLQYRPRLSLQHIGISQCLSSNVFAWSHPVFELQESQSMLGPLTCYGDPVHYAEIPHTDYRYPHPSPGV